MTHSTFIAPYCYRARCDNDIWRDLQRPSNNEGFFFVLCGVIEIHHEAKEHLVYKKGGMAKQTATGIVGYQPIRPAHKH